jgi:hypothetical protein
MGASVVAVGSGMLEGTLVRIPTAPVFASTSMRPGAGVGVGVSMSGMSGMSGMGGMGAVLTSVASGTRMGGMGPVRVPIPHMHMDLAGIVVTHALLAEGGLAAILEALHREGLTVSMCTVCVCMCVCAYVCVCVCVCA